MTKLRNRNKTKRRHHATKRRSHRTRSQRGGDLLYTISFGKFGKPPDDTVPVATGLSDQPSLWTKITNYVSGPTDSENLEITKSIKNTVDGLDAKVGDVAKNMTEGAIELAEEAKNEANKIVEETTGYVRSEENDTLIGSPSPITGGKSRKHKNRKGGANLGLLYYATPVDQKTLMKGGKKHKHTCCKGKSKGKCKRHNVSCIKK
jgi:hypothetical protein